MNCASTVIVYDDDIAREVFPVIIIAQRESDSIRCPCAIVDERDQLCDFTDPPELWSKNSREKIVGAPFWTEVVDLRGRHVMNVETNPGRSHPDTRWILCLEAEREAERMKANNKLELEDFSRRSVVARLS